jgi:hypothetical protein
LRSACEALRKLKLLNYRARGAGPASSQAAGPALSRMMQTMKSTPSPAILLKRKWKLVQCAAKLKHKRKPRIRTMIKEAEKDGKKVSGATVAADGSVTLQFGEAQTDQTNEPNPWERAMQRPKQ